MLKELIHPEKFVLFISMSIRISILSIVLLLGTLLNVPAQTMQAFLKAGTEAMEEEDFFSAQTYFQRVLKFESDHLYSNYNLAEAYFNTNDLSNATVYYKRTLELDDTEVYKKAGYNLALIRMKKGDYKVALEWLNIYLPFAQEDSKAEVERHIRNCEFSVEAVKHPVPVRTQNMGDKINSPYSDFSAQIIDETNLYYSSLRFLGKFSEVKTDSRISKILMTSRSGDKWKAAKELPSAINRPNSHNCNSSITADQQIMVFTRCNYNDEGKLICNIYESKWSRNSWSSPTRLPSTINERNSSNTHPHLSADGVSGYKLYFVSDREGGKGETDIWISKRASAGNYSKPVNAGEVINTLGKEASPYYDSKKRTLYFSSDHHTGFGGYDIFTSEMENDDFAEIENAGYPLNSGFDDLYFRPDIEGDKAMFASNREESQYITSSSCCFDLYRAEYYIPEPENEDTLLTPVQVVINKLSEYLPLKLYFHNDEPDPKTLDTTTQKFIEMFITDPYVVCKETVNFFHSN